MARISAPPSSTSLGQVYFNGALQLGGSVTSTNDTVIYSGVPGSLALVTREGDAALMIA